MGPIIGMSPDSKKAESPGAPIEPSGLSVVSGTLPEAECASSPLATTLDHRSSSTGGDEELTNLNWLHENLLQNFTLGCPEAQSSPSPLLNQTNAALLASSTGGHRVESVKSKPPFSFSLLIYMAIEESPTKSLPVKDIYGWILTHFPYFSSAPTGWKNSVRHNLSLNKCFRKVERSLGKVNGKGSLWCVDPEYRPSLIQALKKQHFPTTHSLCLPPAFSASAFSPSSHLFLQGCSLKESDIDAATAMMLLNSTPGHHTDSCDLDSPMDLSRPDSVLVSSDPKQDHNYSSSSFQRCSSSSSSSSLCSLDGSGCDPTQARRAGSEGFHSDEDSDEERNTHLHVRRHPMTIKHSLVTKHARQEDEELQEAAGSLLHLAGVHCGLDLSKRTSTNLEKHWK